MILFCDRGCPSAHRVLALVHHLQCPVDLRQSLLGEECPGLSRYSASGLLPLSVHDGLVLTESRVMLEHLAEQYGLPNAYPVELAARSRHRRAMAVVNEFLAPLLFTDPGADIDRARLCDVLDALQEATESVPPGSVCLLSLYVGPIWLRFARWHVGHAVTRAIESRSTLRDWLQAAAQLDCVQHTAPDPRADAEDLERARQAGLLPIDTTKPQRRPA